MSLFPRSRGRIRREASDWVVRLAQDSNEETLAAFRRWHDADPRHAEVYARIAAIWSDAGRLSRSPESASERAAARAESPRAIRFALAASLAAAVLVSVLLLGSRWLAEPASQQEPMLLAAGVGDIRKVDLPDGSLLTLDSDSRVEAAFSSTERRLILRQGRARFQVAHEPRPFVVRAGSSEIVATGTLFDVSLIGGRTAVVLLEGSVEVRGVGGPKTRIPTAERLKPGEKMVVTDSVPAERQPATRGDTSWPTRMLEFDDTRLDEAAALANRYSNVQLRLGDGRIGGLRVTGAFRAGDVAGLARSLAAAFDLRLVTLADGSLLLVRSNSDERGPAQ